MSRQRVITAKERDEMVDQLKALMERWRVGPYTVGRLAQVASREARQ